MSMGAARLRSLIQTSLGRVGLTLTHHPASADGQIALGRLRDAGMTPRTVIDVGAAYGDWSTACATVFPDSSYVLLEPVDEYRPILDATAARLADATVIASAASRVSGETTFNVHRDFVGSSLLTETEGGGVDGVARSVRTARLDDLASELSLEGPFLLKIDVQGAELAVLEGAPRVLECALGVILEVSFLEFFVGGAGFADVVQLMADRGFLVYDIFDLTRRPVDRALAQADLLFVRHDAAARDLRGFATSAQRRAQNERFQAEFSRRAAEAQRATSSHRSA